MSGHDPQSVQHPLEPSDRSNVFPVAVMMTRQPALQERAWQGDSWRIVGVVTSACAEQWNDGYNRVRSGDGSDSYLWGGLRLSLYRDDAESYYYNLVSANPSVFVIWTSGEQGHPEPFLVSASFDEAHAYLEAENEVEAVPMPPELYKSVDEGFEA